jgi:hypothetical protein
MLVSKRVIMLIRWPARVITISPGQGADRPAHLGREGHGGRLTWLTPQRLHQPAGRVTVNASRLCWVAIEPMPVTVEPAGASAVSR